MARTISIGSQGFADLRENGYFFVDKSGFVRDWWRSGDSVTLICRPRRFGKTLNMSMVECFFSQRFEGRLDLFSGLEVWDDAELREEQGRWPVISLSLAGVKPSSFEEMKEEVARVIAQACRTVWPKGYDAAPESMRGPLERIREDMDDVTCKNAVNTMSEALYRQTGKRAILLLDEYDTVLQEAWLSGFWDEAARFMRGFFNASFKTNPFMERALITGITRIAHESIFSDFNNAKVVTTSSDEYAHDFGFEQCEVDGALAEFDLSASRDAVRDWYDGFTFGDVSDIYNPWSITNYLDTGQLSAFWANSSGNALVSSLVRQADAQFKADFEVMLEGGSVKETVNAQIAFPDLDYDPSAVWSLLVASGYLQAQRAGMADEGAFMLSVTNRETMLAFDAMVKRWFARVRVPYNGFVRALLAEDLDAMNDYMNEVVLDSFSFFDAGERPSGSEPERFYHGFVLGLLVELRDRYLVRSNRESGYGRYDVMLVPKDPSADDGIVLEFKVRNPRREATLEEAVAAAHRQIAEKRYAAELVAQGVPEDHVRTYALAFEGKRVLVG